MAKIIKRNASVVVNINGKEVTLAPNEAIRVFVKQSEKLVTLKGTFKCIKKSETDDTEYIEFNANLFEGYWKPIRKITEDDTCLIKSVAVSSIVTIEKIYVKYNRKADRKFNVVMTDYPSEEHVSIEFSSKLGKTHISNYVYGEMLSFSFRSKEQERRNTIMYGVITDINDSEITIDRYYSNAGGVFIKEVKGSVDDLIGIFRYDMELVKEIKK